MKYSRFTFGHAEAIFNIIGGEAAVDAALAGKKKIVLVDVEPATSPDQPKKFVATVAYIFIPAMDELKRQFPTYVNPAYDGITFKSIKDCEKFSRETREVEFEYVHLGQDGSNDAVLAEIDKRGLRPALIEELLAFDAKYPEEMAKFPIAALGSEANVGSDRGVAYLWDGGIGRSLRLYSVGSGWDGSCRFLCVRKEEKLAA